MQPCDLILFSKRSIAMKSTTIFDGSGPPKSLFPLKRISLQERLASITLARRSNSSPIKGSISANKIFASSMVKNFAFTASRQTKRDARLKLRRPVDKLRSVISYQQAHPPPLPVFSAPVLLAVLNECPQPHDETALGLSIRNPPPIKLSS